MKNIFACLMITIFVTFSSLQIYCKSPFPKKQWDYWLHSSIKSFLASSALVRTSAKKLVGEHSPNP